MNIEPSLKLLPSPNVHARRFDQELIVLDLEKGVYFGLNEVGAALWEGFVEGRSLREILDVLASQYEVSEPRLWADAERIIHELLQAGLVVERPGGGQE
jgi:hypothetical protein